MILLITKGSQGLRTSLTSYLTIECDLVRFQAQARPIIQFSLQNITVILWLLAGFLIFFLRFLILRLTKSLRKKLRKRFSLNKQSTFSQRLHLVNPEKRSLGEELKTFCIGLFIFVLYLYYMPMAVLVSLGLTCTRSRVDGLRYNNYDVNLVCDFSDTGEFLPMFLVALFFLCLYLVGILVLFGYHIYRTQSLEEKGEVISFRFWVGFLNDNFFFKYYWFEILLMLMKLSLGFVFTSLNFNKELQLFCFIMILLCGVLIVYKFQPGLSPFSSMSHTPIFEHSLSTIIYIQRYTHSRILSTSLSSSSSSPSQFSTNLSSKVLLQWHSELYG